MTPPPPGTCLSGVGRGGGGPGEGGRGSRGDGSPPTAGMNIKASPCPPPPLTHPAPPLAPMHLDHFERRRQRSSTDTNLRWTASHLWHPCVRYIHTTYSQMVCLWETQRWKWRRPCMLMACRQGQNRDTLTGGLPFWPGCHGLVWLADPPLPALPKNANGARPSAGGSTQPRPGAVVPNWRFFDTWVWPSSCTAWALHGHCVHTAHAEAGILTQVIRLVVTVLFPRNPFQKNEQSKNI